MAPSLFTAQILETPEHHQTEATCYAAIHPDTG